MMMKAVKDMQRRKANRGFTMVELLAVVAIIGILAGVGFIGVQNHQRSVQHLEQDAIAKEIFVAAQNHLTMLRNEGLLGLGESDLGTRGTHAEDEGKDVYYVIGPDIAIDNPTNILNFMLPAMSIDETVRTGGKYLIRYQKSSGLVLDVFYCETKKKDRKFGVDAMPDYSTLMNLRPEAIDEAGNITKDPNRGSRINHNGAVIGWYGGAQAVSLATVDLKAPTIEIENGAKLIVRVNDMGNLAEDATNEAKGSTLQLVITGETSKVQAVVTLRNKNDGTDPAGSKNTDDRITQKDNTYSLVLDDITKEEWHFADLPNITTEGWHFADLSNSGLVGSVKPAFIPGENITVQAQVFSQNKLSNIAYSDEEKTNSLFEKIVKEVTIDKNGKKIEKENLDSETVKVYTKAYINNARHLENLDSDVSGFEPDKRSYESDVPSFTITDAEQSTDISWTDFMSKTGKNTIYYKAASSTSGSTESKTTQTQENCYKPVNLNYVLNYDGGNHNVSNLIVKWAGDAGMFGTVENGGSIMNLALIDSSITASTGNAGALAGTLTNTTVENVIAYNSSNTVEENKITASTGSAGGLVGSMTGTLIAPKDKTPETSTGSIKKSAAALIVNGSDNAGGLIGKASGITVDACYSGGHTDKKDAAGNTIGGVYDDTVGNYNVTASESGIAGGLIGAATGMGNIENSYSTCSVSGGTVGGFVGTYEGAAKTYEGVANTNKISNCYATGLVQGTSEETQTIPDPSDPDNNSKATTINMPKDGAFAYSIDKATVTGCKYYEIINERVERDTSTGTNKSSTIFVIKPTTMTAKDTFVYLAPLGQGKTDSEIKALDESAASYDGFVGGQDKWKKTNAFVYDAKLGKYYNDNNTIVYNLPGIVRLDTITDYDAKDADYFVEYHHGDWPAPEIFVFNEATTSG